MIYEQDFESIRDARSEVDDIKLDIQIHEIDKQIDGINEQIENLENYYDGLIESTERMYDSQIEALKGIKDQWESIAEMADYQKAIDTLESFGISVQDIFSGNADVLNKFKERYLDVANAINNYEITGATDGLAEGFDNAASSASNLSNTINGAGGISSNSGSTGNSENESSGSSSSTSLKSAIADQTEDAEEKLNLQKELFNGEEGLKGAVQEVIDTIGVGGQESEGATGEETENANTLSGAIQSQYDLASEVIPQEVTLFDEMKTSIANCVTELQNMITALETIANTNSIGVGSISGATTAVVGKAFASGNSGLPHAEKNALRSEYGQPELTVYPDGTTELTTKPVMSDLPKDTVIFNEEQTRKIMNNKGTILGNAYANGTVLRPLQEGDSGYALMKSAEIYQDMLRTQIVPPLNAIDNNMDMVARNISNVNNKTQSYSVGDIHIHCSGITSKDVAQQVVTELDKTFFGMSNLANQRASITR